MEKKPPGLVCETVKNGPINTHRLTRGQNKGFEKNNGGEMTFDDKVARLRELERKATPGPWEFKYDNPKCPKEIAHIYRKGPYLGQDIATLFTEPDNKNDPNLIAESRNVFRELVLEVLRLREQIRSGTRLEKGREGA